MGNNVLIISNPEDEHTHVVDNALRSFGCSPVMFWPERLGTDYYLSMYFDGEDPSPCQELHSGVGRLSLRDFDSV